MSGSTEIFQGNDGQWYFRVKGANGERVAQSEGYDSKSNAERGLVGEFGETR